MSSAHTTLLEESRDALDQIPIHQPPYDFEVGLADGYDDLLSGEFSDVTDDLDQLLDLIRLRGRLLLSGHAGTGKTSLSLRLMARAVKKGWPTLRVDLRRWTPTIDERWRRSIDAEALPIGLLSPLATPPVMDRLIRDALGEGSALVVVDGLNEVPARSARAIPMVLDLFARRNPQIGVVLCDRFQRRELPSEDWLLGTISEVRGASPSPPVNSALLLDISEGKIDTGQTEADILLDFLCAKAEIKSPDDGRLADSALRLYKDESRYFEWSALIALLSDADIAVRLASSGTIDRDGDWASFRHHLFHDALAAHAVARHPECWEGGVFDTLTFNANSFDAVGLGLEQIREGADANRFLLSVYDWNLYAAAYALARGRRLGTLAVDSNTEEAMLAVLAERRWDPVAPSAQRVSDALRVFETELARRYLGARDVEEVFSIVAEGNVGEGRGSWRQLFLGRVGTNRLLDELVDGGPLKGWIAANSLRRSALGADEFARLVGAFEDASGTVRWRAIHVLGSQPGADAAALLLGALDDDDWVWVRYGAIRALVEMAGSSEELRESIVAALVERLPALVQEPRVLTEMEKALQLREPPDGWGRAVAPLLEELFSVAPTVADQDHWRAVGRKVEASIQAARAEPT
jgi:HEAT repeats